MIRKIIKISGTGKFLNYDLKSVPVIHRTEDFEKINLIYGENGMGKTTLSVVLSSLKGDNSLLSKKRSFNKTFPQTIELLTDSKVNPKSTFSNSAWDFHYVDIEVFDIHFINESIYTGSEIQTIHKKKLFEIIFGQQGVNLKAEIQNIKDRIKSGIKILKETSEAIELAIGNAYSAEVYCKIAIDDLIDTKIINKEAQINTAKSFQLIQQKELLKPISILTYPFDIEKAIEVIGKSITNISAEFLAKFKKHKDHLKMEAAENWLKKGFESIQDNNSCPFCLRSLDETIEIIEAYNQYFNVEYNSLIKSIQELSSKSGQYGLDSQFLNIENEILANNRLIPFWKTHLNNELKELSVVYDKKELIEEFEEVRALLKTKIQNPVVSQNISVLESLKSKIHTFNEKIVALNSEITNYNTKISTLKASRQANIEQLEIELSQLKVVKKRSEPDISNYCKNYLKYKQGLQTLKSQKDEKQQLLDRYTAGIFATYTTKINQYLHAFAPYLEIRGLDSLYVGSSTEPIVKYALYIEGNEIKQDDSQTLLTFKYSLSEGDKSALALAFFLAKLDVDNNLQNKIIVFDDPVSSFDLNRKSTTISKLLHFAQRAKQLFVLTHNIIFAGEFWKSAHQLKDKSQCSKIEFIGTSSTIVKFQIDNETLSSVLKDSLAIKNYLVNGCYSDQERRGMARCLRPALESYFHLKFFDVVLDNEWLGSFIDKVRNSTTAAPYNRLVGHVQEMTEINDFSKKFHHRYNTNADSEQVSDAELRNYCERTLKLIQII